jgi:hypothetical protein
MKSENIEIVKHTGIFLIDEVSMLRADMFDLINHRMQKIMENDLFM